MPKIIARLILVTISIFLSCRIACANEESLHNSNAATVRRDLVKSADRINLSGEFESIFSASSNSIERGIAEARFLKKLWQAESELRRILTEIEEERSALNLAVDRTESRQLLTASTIDSFNFLSSGIISLVGNCLFISAPPPRPEVPNILFSTANGVSTGLSVVSLDAAGGRETTTAYTKESMLKPFFDADFVPGHSEKVWKFLNTSDGEQKLTPYQNLLKTWTEQFEQIKNFQHDNEAIVKIYGLGKSSGKIKLSYLRERLKMLNDLQAEILRMSFLLADLGRNF